MKAELSIPVGMVAYSRFYSLDPCEVAQNTLDEIGRDFAELLSLGVDPWEDERPLEITEHLRN